jgi:hypothetical protein
MRKRLTLSLVVAVTVLSVAAVAVAAQWNSISGSSTTSWFTSATVRHVTTPNDTIQIQLPTRPAGGEYWNLVNDVNGQVFTSTKTIQTSSVVTLATGVLNGTAFHNHYRSVNTPGSFSGQEYY